MAQKEKMTLQTALISLILRFSATFCEFCVNFRRAVS